MNILFIDWENFKNKLKSVLKKEGITNKINWCEYNFRGLFDQVLQRIETDRRIFYAARLKFCPHTAEKSKELIEKQRLLKTYLETQGFEFIYGGRVRENFELNERREKILTFREKGVDVQIAVDMVKMAFENKLELAILASSDSDLQPVIRGLKEAEELKKKNIEIIYLGFEIGHNKGLSYTTDRTILIRNSEVLKFLPQKLL
jgi:uncharacterized LabA/DUF88 family protein